MNSRKNPARLFVDPAGIGKVSQVRTGDRLRTSDGRVLTVSQATSDDNGFVFLKFTNDPFVSTRVRSTALVNPVA